jgi:hypothetical protein
MYNYLITASEARQLTKESKPVRSAQEKRVKNLLNEVSTAIYEEAYLGLDVLIFATRGIDERDLEIAKRVLRRSGFTTSSYSASPMLLEEKTSLIIRW